MTDSNVVTIRCSWGSSAIATMARIVYLNPGLEMSALMQHAAAAGLTNKTTVTIYANSGPWEGSGEGNSLRLSYDQLGFGTEWEVPDANSGRTLPLCEGAFFVDGAFPRWIVFAKAWNVVRGALVLDLPLVAAVHIAASGVRQISVDSCVGQTSEILSADLTCNARSAKLDVTGITLPRGTRSQIAVSIPLLADIPLQLHRVPSCEQSSTIEGYFDSLLRENGSRSEPALGFAGLVGFNHPNFGLAPALEISEDRRGLALAYVRRRLQCRAEDEIFRTAALAVSMALEIPSNGQSGQEVLSDKEDSTHNVFGLGTNRQIKTSFKTSGFFPIGTYVTHVSGLVSGTVIASDEDNTTIKNKSIRFSGKTRYFIDPNATSMPDTGLTTNDARLDNIEDSESRKAAAKSNPKIPTDRKEILPRKRRIPIELHIAEKAALAFPRDRNQYVKAIYRDLCRYIVPLGDFYTKLALRRLREAVRLAPKES